MTCIVGFLDKGKIHMGGDSAAVAGLEILIRKDPKVFKKDKMIFGYTSSFRMGQLIRFSLKIPNHPRGMGDYEYVCTKFIEAVRDCLKDGGYSVINNNKEAGGEFLVGYKKNLFNIYDDFQVGWNSDKYSAVGCGAHYALGAMKTNNYIKSPELRVKQALAVASYFSGGVRPPFIIETL